MAIIYLKGTANGKSRVVHKPASLLSKVKSKIRRK